MIIVAAFLLIVIGLIAALLYFYQPCGGLVGIGCRENYECNVSSSEVTDSFGHCIRIEADDEPVEYQESYGLICPVGVELLGSKTAPEIKCQCPDGYEMDSDIIGYSTGDECYCACTECPIMSSKCISK